MAIEDKVAALFAKAASTDSEHERDALIEAAQRLIIKYGLDEAKIRARTLNSRAGVTREVAIIEGPLGLSLSVLLALVVEGLGTCEVLHFDVPQGHANILIGHKNDIDRNVALYQSISAQALRAMSEWYNKQAADPWMIAFSAYGLDLIGVSEVQQHDYLVAYGVRVCDRLKALVKEQKDADDEGSKALVLSRDDVAVRRQEWFPNAQAEQVETSNDPRGTRAGLAAGDQADIGLGKIGAPAEQQIGQ